MPVTGCRGHLPPTESDYYPIRAPAEAFEITPVPGDDERRKRPEPVD